MNTTESAVVVVGAGHAGAESAVALRQAGYQGRIILIGDESRLPYHRPPLSKGFLAGTVHPDALLLKQQAVYDKANIEFRAGAKVERINRAQMTVTLAGGEEVAYTQLVLATGSRPRVLNCPGLRSGAGASNLYTLRTIDDVERIRERFKPGARLLIVGAGYIGLEVAAVAIKSGLQVTVLEAQARVLARVAAPAVSAFFEHLHREAGVAVRVNAQIERVTLDASGNIASVTTNDGTVTDTDLVIAGIGVEPNVELAFTAGLDVDNGIVVNEFLQTSDPAILAIGDCSNHLNPIYGRRIRLESVPNALEQARVAAGVISDTPVPYASVPWFWSDQYDVKLQMAGLSQGYDQAVTRGSMEAKSFATFYLRHGMVIAADCVNRAQDFMMAKKLIAARRAADGDALANDGIPLKSIAESV